MASQQDKGPIYDIIERQAERSGIPRDDFLRFAYVETGGRFNPDARNDSGARGLFQIMPDTAARYNIAGREFDPVVNAEAAARYYLDNQRQVIQRSEQTGRPFLSGEGRPNGLDMYLSHQQGAGGYASIQSAIATGAFSRSDTRGNILSNIYGQEFERITGHSKVEARTLNDRELASAFSQYWQEKYAAVSIPERGIQPLTAAGQGRERATPLADGVLQRGERGAEVTALQGALNQLGFRDRYGQVLETRSGIFGDRTVEAVSAFQAASQLGATGRVDQRTREAIDQQLALPEQQRNAAAAQQQRQPTARSEGGLVWPAPGNNGLNRADKPGEGHPEFGASRRNGSVRYRHTGVDILGDVGDPVVAIAGGVVTVQPNAGRAGNKIVIDHGDGTSSAYLHLNGFNVRNGQRVEAGQQIATLGATGNPPGDAHLHLELRRGGKLVDPLPYLQGAERGAAGGRDAAAPAVLREGASGNEVRQLQRDLNQLGYTGANGRALETSSGLFGAQTDHALRAFQLMQQGRLVEDGAYGPATRAAMTAALAEREGRAGVSVGAPQQTTARPVQSGSGTDASPSFLDSLVNAVQEGGDRLRAVVEERVRQVTDQLGQVTGGSAPKQLAQEVEPKSEQVRDHGGQGR